MTRPLAFAAALACLLGLAPAARAQVTDDPWDDPTLDAAVRDADLIVLGECTSVAPGGGAAYRVAATLKGPARDGREVLVSGLVAPGDSTPTVEVGDRAYLVLRGDPTRAVLTVPTPSFGRFPVLDFGGRPHVVTPFSDTFVRVACPQQRFERAIQGLLRGAPPEGLLDDARSALGAEDPNEVYQGLELLRLFGQTEDEAHIARVLADERYAGPRRYRVRLVAAEALARLAGARAVEPLLQVVEKDPVEAVKSAAATALGPVLADLPDGAERRRAAERLATAALGASSIPVRFGAATDKRKNDRASPLAALLQTLAFARSPAGVAPALRALERPDDVPATLAGLAYFGLLGDPQHAAAIARRMRDPSAEDAIVNELFERTLEKLTGQHLGRAREPWLKWCRDQQLGVDPQGPPAPHGPPAPPGPPAPREPGGR